MKKYLFLFALPLCVACADVSELDEAGNSQDVALSRADIPVEEAFPDAEKEVYMTKSGIALAKLDSLYILEGDIILSPEQVAILDGPQTRGAMLTSTNGYWDFCKVYYDFDANFTYKSKVLEAMAKISAEAGVTFLPKESYNKNYVHFFNGVGNYSKLGKYGGRQDISIQNDQYSVVGVTMHEILHALGIYHEMSRSDRDTYVEILWNNIESDSKKHNFQTFTERKEPGVNIGSFNFSSIMMYPSTAFGKKVNDVQQQTIRRRDGLSYTYQRSYLADTDIATLRTIYGPPYLKLRTEIKYKNYHSDDYDFWMEADYPTYAEFYSDKECTIPATLTSPRYLNVVRMENNNGTSTVPQYTTVVVPAGVSSYLVATGYANKDEYYGQPQHSWTIDYSVVNCHKNGY